LGVLYYGVYGCQAYLEKREILLYNINRMSYKLLADKNQCYFCGVRNDRTNKSFRNLIEVHHIVEQNQGGSNEPNNLVPCCSNCHSKVHMNLIQIDKWYNVGYCYKLKWIDENEKEWFGPFKPD
jgi:hypothetical protein